MKNLILALVILSTSSVLAQESKTGNAKGAATNAASEIKFIYPTGMTAEAIRLKKGDDGKSYVLVTNESTPLLPKYRINIYQGNKRLAKATNLIELDATSGSREHISVGSYRFSDKDDSDKKTFRFAGKVRVGEAVVDIVDGWFQLNRLNKRIVINYNLTLKNGVKTTGKYDTEYQNEDRSEQEPGNTGIKLNQQ